MTDGQTETNECIAAQNAEPRCVKLEPGESVKWHDGRQWHVGNVLTWSDPRLFGGLLPYRRLVQTCDGTYSVDPDLLSPYEKRCQRCGEEGTVVLKMQMFTGIPPLDAMGIKAKCPECGGSGRRK